ncbi:MAG: multiheme c-type cytochrome [Actinomycetota bacterium]
MGPLKQRGRVWVGAAVSLLVFAWCLASSARSDNQRWVQSLHGGHRTAAFQAALDNLNSLRPAGLRLDECSACHGKRDWVSNLVSARPMVADEKCGTCHLPRPAEVDADVKTSPAGLPWLGKRLHRPGHAGIDYPGMVAGLAPKDRRIACAECHPDHEGEQLLDRRLSESGGHPAKRVKVEETNRFLMTRICSGCHLPQEPSAEATQVLREFVKAHSTGDGFDPPLPKELQDEVAAASPNAPMAGDLQNRIVKSVTETVGKQMLLGIEEDPSLRGCTPGCHGEHTPMTNDEEDYNKKRESAAVPARFARLFRPR